MKHCVHSGRTNYITWPPTLTETCCQCGRTGERRQNAFAPEGHGPYTPKEDMVIIPSTSTLDLLDCEGTGATKNGVTPHAVEATEPEEAVPAGRVPKGKGRISGGSTGNVSGKNPGDMYRLRERHPSP